MTRKQTPGPPDRLRILGKTWGLVPIEDAPLQGNNRGECNFTECRIRFKTDGSPDDVRDTVLHEVIHALDYTMQLGLKERQVHALAAGVLAVLRDNRRLNEWLVGGESL
jgi:hypothetical protein